MELYVKICYEAVKEPLRQQVLNTFTQDRNGNGADEMQLIQVVKCYVQMGLA
jgi:hypothetical protein